METTALKTDQVVHESGARCEFVNDFTRLLDLSHRWQRWTQQTSLADVFQHRQWLHAISKAYAPMIKPCAAVVYRGEDVLGVLTLAQTGRKLAFLGSPESEYNDLICAKGTSATVLEAAIRGLMRSSMDWDSCILDNLPASSRILSALPALPPVLQKHLQLVVRWPSPTVMLDVEKDQVLETLINKDQLKRYDRKLQKVGRIAFRHIETRREAREHLGTFFRQHITRCAMAGHRSQFLREDRRAFYEALIEEYDLCTHLRFGVLELDCQPVAYHFGFQYDTKFIWYKSAFDVNYWRYCPGDVLLRHLFRYVRESNIREFDFSVGDEPFKFRFANHAKQNYALYIDRHPSLIRSHMRKAMRCAESAVRSRPAVKCVLKDCARVATAGVGHLKPGRAGNGLGKPGWDGIDEIFRAAVWARDEALVFSIPAQLGWESSRFQAIPADLATVATLSAEYPEGLDVSRLRECRRRLNQAHRAFIGCGDQGEVVLFWLAQRNDIVIREIGPECRVPLPAPTWVVYECWSAPHFNNHRVPPEFLKALAGRCGGGELWSYVMCRDASGYRGIVDAGFQPQERLSHRTLLHWFRSSSLEPDTSRQQ